MTDGRWFVVAFGLAVLMGPLVAWVAVGRLDAAGFGVFVGAALSWWVAQRSRKE